MQWDRENFVSNIQHLLNCVCCTAYVQPWICHWHATQCWTMQPNGHRSIKEWEGNQANSFKCLTSCLETFASPQGLTDPQWPESAHWSVSPLQRSAACWECVVVFVFLLTLRRAYGSQYKGSTQLLSTLILSHSSLQRWTTGHLGMHEHTHMAFKAPPFIYSPLLLLSSFHFQIRFFHPEQATAGGLTLRGRQHDSRTERTSTGTRINFCQHTKCTHMHVYMHNIRTTKRTFTLTKTLIMRCLLSGCIFGWSEILQEIIHLLKA